MTKTVYWPTQMVQSVLITVDGREHSLPLKWEKGQIGVMQVFESEEAAQAVAGEGAYIASGTMSVSDKTSD